MEYEKLWIVNDVQDEKVNRTAKEAGISNLLARIFLSRGIDDAGYIKEFLNPSLDSLHNPFLLKDMEKAADRIIRAVRDREKILIYGDYDVDGVTSTSILYDFLKKQEAKVSYFIPDRLDEGYGLSISAIDKILDMDVNLIITVDCGITAFEEVRYIVDNNIDIIITDHHECKEGLPQGYAVINPLRPDCAYPFKELAGVGVAFKLVQALSGKMKLNGFERRYLDLAALGTVADVVPLLGENRVIVKYGLSMIESSSNIGLRSIIKVSGVEDRKITSYVISFVIAPRINAAGRIGDAERAVRLLTTDSETEAVELAKELDAQNKYRQDTELSIWEEVVDIIEKDADIKRKKVIVVSGEGWHHGIIGIVASKITEKYNRPCVLITIEYGMGKGSGRSIEGFNLFKALNHCESVLDKYGGHELAAGLTLKAHNIEEFSKVINEYADSVLLESDLIPKVKIDVGIKREDVTLNIARELELLAPFGANNPGPVFKYGNIKVSEIRTVGNDKHVKLRLDDNGFIVNAIGFNKGNLINIYDESDVLDIACSLEVNSWNGSESVQLNIKDVKLSEDIIMENKFYLSLDGCIDFNRKQDDNIINSCFEKIDVIDSGRGITEEINALVSQGERAAVLVNSLEGVKKLTEALESDPFSFKIRYSISYGDFSLNAHDELYVVVNPKPGKLDFESFDRVVLLSDWISRDYLYEVLSGIDLSKVYVYNRINFNFNEDEIILKRHDMVAVYQYIKSSFGKDFILDDLFAFARNIAKSYRITMNYFKVKRIIEVFEELGLLEKLPYGKYGMSISVLDSGKSKTSLENSSLFRSIQELREQLLNRSVV